MAQVKRSDSEPQALSWARRHGRGLRTLLATGLWFALLLALAQASALVKGTLAAFLLVAAFGWIALAGGVWLFLRLPEDRCRR